jgi:hypothetical protein
MMTPRSVFGASPQEAPPADRQSRIRGDRLRGLAYASPVPCAGLENRHEHL